MSSEVGANAGSFSPQIRRTAICAGVSRMAFHEASYPISLEKLHRNSLVRPAPRAPRALTAPCPHAQSLPAAAGPLPTAHTRYSPPPFSLLPPVNVCLRPYGRTMPPVVNKNPPLAQKSPLNVHMYVSILYTSRIPL